jgi:hypothetical protein
MKTYTTVVLAALAGAGIGGLAVQGLHAQTKLPTAFYIAEIDVTNEDVTTSSGFRKSTRRSKPRAASTSCAAPTSSGSRAPLQSGY